MPAVSQLPTVASLNAELPESLLATLDMAADEAAHRARSGKPHDPLNGFGIRNAEMFSCGELWIIAYAAELGYREGLYLKELGR